MIGHPSSPRRSSACRKRGFSLIEMSFAAGISAAVVAGGLLWLTAMSRSSADTNDSRRIRQEAELVDVLFFDDVTSSIPCDGLRREDPVREVSPTSVVLTRDADSDGLVDQVEWQVSASTLSRSIAVGTGDCEFGTPSVVFSTETVATDLTPTAMFSAGDGTGMVPQTATVDCSGVPSACGWEAIEMHVVLRSVSGVVVDVVSAGTIGQWGAS